MLRRSLTPHPPMDLLTVREHFALTLLASLAGRGRATSLEDLALVAVYGADALIAELNKRQGGGVSE
jgi:hypothetical protein